MMPRLTDADRTIARSFVRGQDAITRRGPGWWLSVPLWDDRDPRTKHWKRLWNLGVRARRIRDAGVVA